MSAAPGATAGEAVAVTEDPAVYPVLPVDPNDLASVTLGIRRAELAIKQAEQREVEGELIERSAHRAALAAAIVPRMTRVLGVPTALRQALPHLSLEDIAVAERLLRESLAGEDDAPELDGADLDVLEAWCRERRAELAVEGPQGGTGREMAGGWVSGQQGGGRRGPGGA